MSQAMDADRRYCPTCSQWVDAEHEHDVWTFDDDASSNGRDELKEKLIEMEQLMQSVSNRLDGIEAVVYGDEPGVRPSYDLVSEVERLREVVDAHEDTIALMEVPTDAESFSREQRRTKIRQALRNKLRNSDGSTATYDYNDVRTLFESTISEPYASKLLKEAAGNFPDDPSQPVKGFEYISQPGNARSVLRAYQGTTSPESVSRVNNRSEVRSP